MLHAKLGDSLFSKRHYIKNHKCYFSPTPKVTLQIYILHANVIDNSSFNGKYKNQIYKDTNLRKKPHN